MECPICGAIFPINEIEDHVNRCLDDNEARSFTNPAPAAAPLPTPKASVPPMQTVTKKKDKSTKDTSDQIDLLDHFLTSSTEFPGVSEIQTQPIVVEDHAVTLGQKVDFLIDFNELQFTDLYNAYQKTSFSKDFVCPHSKIRMSEMFTQCHIGSSLINVTNALQPSRTSLPTQKEQKYSVDITIPIGIGHNVFPLLVGMELRYFDVVIYFPKEGNLVIFAHSFILAARSPLFQVELNEMERIEGVFFYGVTEYSYTSFFALINYMYKGITKQAFLDQAAELEAVYSPSNNPIIEDILALKNPHFYDGFFSVTKNNVEVKRIGFSRLLFFMFSEYFNELFERKQREYSNTGRLRRYSELPHRVGQSVFDTIISTLKMDNKSLPTGDPEPFVFVIKGDNEEVDVVEQAIYEIVSFIYHNGVGKPYVLDESKMDDMTKQRVVPIVLHFSYLFKETVLSIECEKVLKKNLLVNTMNCNGLFLSMRNASWKFKRFLVEKLAEGVLGCQHLENIVRWTDDVVDCFYEILFTYGLLCEEGPSETNLRKMETYGVLGVVSFCRESHKQSDKVSEFCLAYFERVMQRRDIIEFLGVNGYEGIRPLICACSVGGTRSRKYQERSVGILRRVLSDVVKEYSNLALSRGNTYVTEALFRMVTDTLNSDMQVTKMCNVCYDNLGLLSKRCEMCGQRMCKKCCLKGFVLNFNNNQRTLKTLCYRCHRIWCFLSSVDYYQISK
ncbi:hypothetical protein EIN_274310 [Entamoeba invadens IP1]|uniref:BTB domain-containing protein n=1 Tax=Entamoeba invadens IP1 TaxID=370355 RepID=A0A0A1U1E4_ENTIV|nr:hypothetical protein EIN_274310 [Entamoeba invadens IP1]ELP87864.1 hypothetical protein EIN_274310 [Entamoeba invadens IP1]|eukprot:XP_004254635.1 hypothetical protein EIN_274310 [Entamoeba invadens IP1]